jgi:hypothetical protein
VFVVAGREGAVTLTVMTGWAGGESEEHPGRRPLGMHRPLAVLGFHPPASPGDPKAQECPYLGGRACRHDSSGLAGDRLFSLMLAEGHAALWRALEEHYAAEFAGRPT